MIRRLSVILIIIACIFSCGENCDEFRGYSEKCGCPEGKFLYNDKCYFEGDGADYAAAFDFYCFDYDGIIRMHPLEGFPDYLSTTLYARGVFSGQADINNRHQSVNHFCIRPDVEEDYEYYGKVILGYVEGLSELTEYPEEIVLDLFLVERKDEWAFDRAIDGLDSMRIVIPRYR